MFRRVLIVDDELLARNALRSAIDWEAFGFALCGEAEDGIKAIRLIGELNPHIALVDIDMPHMDGVSLCRYISEHCPEVAVVVLSNYDKYDYVRDTMSSGAVDYVLKHRLDADMLLGVLNRASARVKPAGSGESWAGRSGHAAAIVDRLLQEDGAPLPPPGSEAAALLRPFAGNAVVLAMQPLHPVQLAGSPAGDSEDGNTGTALFLRSVVELCRQLAGDPASAYVSFDAGSGRIVFLLSYEAYRSEAPIRQSVQALTDKIGRTLRLVFNMGAAFGSSPVCHGPAGKLRAYCVLAHEALDRRLAELGSHPAAQIAAVSLSAAAPATGRTAALTIKQEKELLAAIVVSSQVQIERIVDDAFDAFARRAGSYAQFVALVEELVHLAHRVGKKGGADVGWIAADLADKRPKLERSDEVRAWVKTIFGRLVALIGERQIEGKYSKHVEEAMSLIRAHYRDGVTLEEAAATIGITPSYLSRLFKEETGMSFTESINHHKIELSKQYIESGDHTIKELYRGLGFNNYSYFFKVFKDIVGETPQSYAKKYMRGK
ncbi:response regulator transcription factor [Paenibacillus cymbidii]|uniref:response regulator transcription factor n=1 Tax=Paenibacillus cymbidii TaxID=1639034 RepID=UPI00108145D2|nr:response regulator [Paenibacillus cymbidii]